MDSGKVLQFFRKNEKCIKIRKSISIKRTSWIESKFQGKIFGYLPFNNKILLFSTDIYCGIQLSEDLVQLYTWKGKQIEDYESYAYIRIDQRTIHLCSHGWAVDNNIELDYRTVGNIVYKLIKK